MEQFRTDIEGDFRSGKGSSGAEGTRTDPYRRVPIIGEQQLRTRGRVHTSDVPADAMSEVTRMWRTRVTRAEFGFNLPAVNFTVIKFASGKMFVTSLQYDGKNRNPDF